MENTYASAHRQSLRQSLCFLSACNAAFCLVLTVFPSLSLVGPSPTSLAFVSLFAIWKVLPWNSIFRSQAKSSKYRLLNGKQTIVQGETGLSSPQLCVGFLFLILYPGLLLRLPPPAATSTHTHTNLTYNNFTHTQLCHIPSLTYHNFTYINLTYNNLPHHTQLCHIPSLTYHNFTYHKFNIQ